MAAFIRLGSTCFSEQFSALKNMTPWIILLPSTKNGNFTDFYCISLAVTNIIIYVVWHLEHARIVSFSIKLKVYYQVLGFLDKSTYCFLAYFQAIFWKVIENGTFLQQNT